MYFHFCRMGGGEDESCIIFIDGYNDRKWVIRGRLVTAHNFLIDFQIRAIKIIRNLIKNFNALK